MLAENVFFYAISGVSIINKKLKIAFEDPQDKCLCCAGKSNAAGLILVEVNNIQVPPIINKICIILYKTSKTGVYCGETGVTCFMFIQSC